jgi:hypothetical protein
VIYGAAASDKEEQGTRMDPLDRTRACNSGEVERAPATQTPLRCD